MNNSVGISPLEVLKHLGDNATILFYGAHKLKRNQTTGDIVLRFKAKHGDRYDYSDVIYVSYYEKVKINCMIHGGFMQAAHHHYDGKGCPKCAKSGVKLNKERVVSDFKSIHGDEFLYGNFIYKNDYSKSIVTCRSHGDFLITPNSHKNGTKCPNCFLERSGYGKSRFISCSKKFNNIASIYLIRCISENEKFYKVGITTDFKRRFTRSPIPYSYEVIGLISGNSSLIWEIEKEIHKELFSYRYTPEIKFSGSTECFNIKSIGKAIELMNINTNATDKEIAQGYRDE